MSERLGRRINPTEKIDVGVIGAGVVGLSVARTLAQKNREVIVFEKEQEIGIHTSSRNSEVIHSGIYYRPGSLKARLCVTGKQTLYEYCAENNIPNKKLGKIIIANQDDDMSRLAQLKERGEANGVHDLAWLDQEQIRELEPMIRSIGGLFSPSTGILDSHRLLDVLKRDAQNNGAWIQILSAVLQGEVQDNGIALVIGGNENITVLCNTVINCAGLFSQDIARRIDGLPKDSIPESFFAKGHYFILKGNSPFSHLIYPLPTPGGLGIHVTLDLNNQARFGPDVSWVDTINYSFEEDREGDFYDTIKTYYPALQNGNLEPGYTGIRPKLGPAGSQEQDFMIQGPQDHGIPGLVNLYGIESPGLTASLAIAEYVARLLNE